MSAAGGFIAQIPARGGSKRVPAKNLRYIAGRPLIAYAIETALESGCFDRVVVNTDSEVIAALATSRGADIYMRPAELGSDTTSGDEFTFDFITAMRPETLAMVSPVCPLVTADDIRRAVAAFRESECDTLITCERTQMQAFCGDAPVNIDVDGPLAPTQQNPAVSILNWAVTIWDPAAFESHFNATGSAYLGRKRLLFPIPKAHGVKISTEDDFELVEGLLLGRARNVSRDAPRYWQPGDGP